MYDVIDNFAIRVKLLALPDKDLQRGHRWNQRLYKNLLSKIFKITGTQSDLLRRTILPPNSPFLVINRRAKNKNKRKSQVNL